MRVSVEVPEPKAGLDAALAKQFADIQRQLMKLVEEKDASSRSMHEMMLEHMEEQQASLVKAMETLIGAMSSSQPSDDLADALQGLKKVMAELPGDLKTALDKQYRTVVQRQMSKAPKAQVTVKMPSGLLNRIDQLEASLLQGLKKSRNRTFGSNY